MITLFIIPTGELLTQMIRVFKYYFGIMNSELLFCILPFDVVYTKGDKMSVELGNGSKQVKIWHVYALKIHWVTFEYKLNPKSMIV